MISVSDNGIGISPDEQQRVWTKFYRSNAYPDMMQPVNTYRLTYSVQWKDFMGMLRYTRIDHSIMYVHEVPEDKPVRMIEGAHSICCAALPNILSLLFTYALNTNSSSPVLSP